MIMKKKLSSRLKSVYSVFFLTLLLFPLFVSCRSSDTEYTKCEEMCEYSKRDCIEGCENYNSFGISIDFGKSGFSSPYACTDKCEKKSERCLEKCKDKKITNE